MPRQGLTGRPGGPSRSRPAGASRTLAPAFFVALLAAGCATLSARPQALAPLEHEGELFVELQALAPGAERLSVGFAAVEAIRSDGTRAPLKLLLPGLSGAEAPRARMLASGRLEPGTYAGLAIRIEKAALAAEKGTADLLLSRAEAEVDAPFSLSARRATLVSVALDARASLERDYAFAPTFTGAEPPRTVPTLAGLCSNAGAHSVSVFDRHTLEATAVVATGSGPWGIAIDSVQNRAYVALSGSDEIEVFDVFSGEELGRARLSAGDAPREVALTPDRRVLLVVNSGSNTLSFVDASMMVETDRVPTGLAPSSLLLDRQGRRAYAFNARGNSITVVDVETRAAVATIGTDDVPLRGQLDRSGASLYVAHESSPYLLVVSLPDLTVSKRLFVGPGVTAIKIDPNTNLLYVAKGPERRLVVYDPFSLLPVDGIDLPDAVSWISIDDAQNALVMLMPARRQVISVDLASRRRRAALDVGPDPAVLALTGERN